MGSVFLTCFMRNISVVHFATYPLSNMVLYLKILTQSPTRNFTCAFRGSASADAGTGSVDVSTTASPLLAFSGVY